MYQNHILLLSLTLILQLFIMSRGFKLKYLFGPVYIAIYLYLIVGISGYLVYSINPDFVFFGYTSIVIKATPEECLQILQYFLFFVNQIAFGALLFFSFCEIVSEISRDLKVKESRRQANFSKKVASVLIENSPPYLERKQQIIKKRRKTKPISKDVNPNFLLFLCMIPTVFLIIGLGPDKLLMRDDYLQSSIRVLVSIGNVLIMPASMGLGYSLAGKTGASNRFACLLLIAANFVTLFSLATRALAMFPILITCGYWFNANRKKGFGIFLCILTAVLFSPLVFLPLYLRGSTSHGLLPYLSYVSELDLATLFQAPIGFISNFLFSFPLTGEMMKLRNSRVFPIDYLLISIDPPPGFFLGWYLIQERLRLNDATPFNTIGEMQLYGDTIAFWLFFSLGGMLAFINTVFQKCLGKSRTIQALVLLMLVFLFSITSLQYNLRSASRILYLVLFLSCFFWF